MKNRIKLIVMLFLSSVVTIFMTGCTPSTAVGVPSAPEEATMYKYQDVYKNIGKNGYRNVVKAGYKKWAVYDKDGFVQWIKKPTEDTLQLFVKNNYENIQHIKRPSFEVQKIAIQQNVKALKYICCPSLELQRIAIKQDIDAILYISKPNIEIQSYVMKKNPLNFSSINNPSEDIQRKAIDANQNNIKYLKDSSFDLQMYIAKTYPKYYRYLPYGYVKPSLIAQVETTFTARPSTFSMKNKELKVLIEDGEIVFKNLTKKFLSIQSISEYYGPTIYKIFGNQDLSLSPESETRWKRTRNVEMKASSMNDIVNYGFAVKYYVAGSQTQKNLYNIKDYTTSQLLQN